MISCPVHIKKGRKIADELNLLLSKGFARVLINGEVRFIEEMIWLLKANPAKRRKR